MKQQLSAIITHKTLQKARYRKNTAGLSKKNSLRTKETKNNYLSQKQEKRGNRRKERILSSILRELVFEPGKELG